MVRGECQAAGARVLGRSVDPVAVIRPRAVAGVEPYASRLKAAPDELIRIFTPNEVKIVVTGGETQAAFKMFGGMYTGAARVLPSRRTRPVASTSGAERTTD